MRGRRRWRGWRGRRGRGASGEMQYSAESPCEGTSPTTASTGVRHAGLMGSGVSDVRDVDVAFGGHIPAETWAAGPAASPFTSDASGTGVSYAGIY